MPLATRYMPQATLPHAQKSDIPGIIKAGTFYENHGQIFWDVHHPENAVVIELKDERYRELVVEVKDPQSSVNEILNAIG